MCFSRSKRKNYDIFKGVCARAVTDRFKQFLMEKFGLLLFLIYKDIFHDIRAKFTEKDPRRNSVKNGD